MASNSKIVDDHLKEYNSRNFERFKNYFLEDAKFFVFKGGVEEVSEGKNIEDFKTLFIESPKLHASVLGRIENGVHVADLEEVTGMPGSDAPIRAITVYEFVDSKIVRVCFFVN